MYVINYVQTNNVCSEMKTHTEWTDNPIKAGRRLFQLIRYAEEDGYEVTNYGENYAFLYNRDRKQIFFIEIVVSFEIGSRANGRND